MGGMKMDELDWTRQNSDVLVWQMPGEEHQQPVVLQKKKSIIRPAAGTAIVLSALITGTLFGVTMIRAVNVPEEKPAAAAVSEAPVKETPEQEMNRVDVTVSVIQGGLFSTEGAAKKSVGIAKAKQIPASFISSGGQYMVLYGVFASPDKAKNAARQLEEKGTAAYVKDVTASMTDTAEKTFIEESDTQKKLDQLKEAMSP
jgi:cell division septation protein DedD